MKNYSVISAGTRQHVVCNARSRNNVYPDANYAGTGMALCGVLKQDETINDFKKMVSKREAERAIN